MAHKSPKKKSRKTRRKKSRSVKRKAVGYTIKKGRVVKVYRSAGKGRTYYNGRKLVKGKKAYKTKAKAKASLKRSRGTKVRSRRCRYGVKKACRSPCKKKRGRRKRKRSRKMFTPIVVEEPVVVEESPMSSFRFRMKSKKSKKPFSCKLGLHSWDWGHDLTPMAVPKDKIEGYAYRNNYLRYVRTCKKCGRKEDVLSTGEKEKRDPSDADPNDDPNRSWVRSGEGGRAPPWGTYKGETFRMKSKKPFSCRLGRHSWGDWKYAYHGGQQAAWRKCNKCGKIQDLS